jgi:hypothetical protein
MQVNIARQWMFFTALAAGLLAPLAALAQPVGQVEFARGVGYAQTPGQGARILGKGLELREGDTLSTSEGSSAIIRMQDGTRMTLRPGTDMVVQRFQYREGATNNSMIMQLFSGGLRAITGLISKNAPEAAKLQTKTATIGIRGYRLRCPAVPARLRDRVRAGHRTAQGQCRAGQRQAGVHAGRDQCGGRERHAPAAGRRRGDLPGRDGRDRAGCARRAGVSRRQPADAGCDHAVSVDSFVFDDKNPGEGKFLVSLLRGSMRALTGLIGKANNRNVGFTTATATVGIRGTGLDMQCDEACSFFSWLGTIEVNPSNPGQGGGLSALQVLSAGQGLFVSTTGIRALPAPPPEMINLPRPDEVPVDTKQLFSACIMPTDQEGLYVFVRDGHIEVTTASEVLHLGKGETGFAGQTGQTLRPLLIPLFLEFDRTPRPDSTNPMLQTMLNETVNRPANQCR